MRLSHSIFVSMAALLLFTAGGSYAASTSQDVDVTVVNNTQARGRGDIGRLNIACGSMDDLHSGSRHLIENGATLDTTCTVEDDESLMLSYLGIGSTAPSRSTADSRNGPTSWTTAPSR